MSRDPKLEAAIKARLERTAGRGKCPVCGRPDVFLRKNGSLREHYIRLPQPEQDLTTPRGQFTVCEGSGGRPKE